MDQTVATSDSPPVVLGHMPSTFVQAMGPSLRLAAANLVGMVLHDMHLLQHCVCTNLLSM